MVTIHERYINEAVRIRETYLSIMIDIGKKEIEINQYKSEIERIMDNNNKYIEKNKKKSVNQIKEELKDELLEIDFNINKIVNKLTPLFEEVQKLEKQLKELYVSIKDKYPGLTENQIQEQIFKSLKR